MFPLQPSPLCKSPCVSRHENNTASRKRNRLPLRRSPVCCGSLILIRSKLRPRLHESRRQQQLYASAKICKDDVSGLRQRTSPFCFCKSFVDGTVFSQLQVDKSLVQHASSGVLQCVLTEWLSRARGKPSSLTGRLSLCLPFAFPRRGGRRSACSKRRRTLRCHNPCRRESRGPEVGRV